MAARKMIIDGVEFSIGKGGQLEASIGRRYLMIYRTGDRSWAGLGITKGYVWLTGTARTARAVAGFLVQYAKPDRRR